MKTIATVLASVMLSMFFMNEDQNEINPDEVTYKGCQYIWQTRRAWSMAGLAHRGDCNNPIHKYANPEINKGKQ